MGTNNSLVVYTTLFERLLLDIADCYSESESRLDLMKIKSRFEEEGISFYTKTLPSLGKAFDKALQGRSPLLSPGLQKRPGTAIPKLFGWLLSRVLTDSGFVRSDADIVAIQHTRQILYFMYKLAIPYEPKTEKTVLDSFVSVEAELEKLCISGNDAVIVKARAFISRVLADSCPKDILPRHGPGSVATGEVAGEKSCFSRIYATLDSEYSFNEYFRLSLSHVVDTYHNNEALESLDAGTAKVVLVPKDSRGPRIISCEPLELQWIQQGQQRKLYALIETHRLTAGHVNFTNQHINRSLALSSSRYRDYVTLDMKDASDRVSTLLVSELFSGTKWLRAMLATRSVATRLPDGVVLQLRKFAPMGSALCFPVEALTFYALAVSMLVVYKNYSWRNAMSKIFVYGDDIICGVKDYDILLLHFPRFGLMFNESKCCTGGFFRESCGCDAYKGVDITPIRLRTRWNHRGQTDATQLVSYVALSNAMWVAGYWRAATYIEEVVQSIYGSLPYLDYKLDKIETNSKSSPSPTSRVIGWYRPHVNPVTVNKGRHRFRVNSDLQRLEIYGYVVSPVYKKYKENGWEACLRALTAGSTGLPSGTYALPHRSRLKRGWGAVFN